MLSFIIAWNSGYSQACCSGGTPLSGNLVISNVPAKNLSFTAAYENNTMKDLYQGTNDINDRSRRRTTKSLLLQSNYSISDKLSATLLLSYVWQEEENIATIGNSNFLNANGFGDMIALLQYQIINSQTNTLVVGLGPKIPAGSTSVHHEVGYLLPADMQPGTGAWDGIFLLYHNK